MSTIREAALALAARGIPVFPCKNIPAEKQQHKQPLTRRGFKDATTDAAQIRAWWTKWPTALIGMPTGNASGIAVIDLDVDPTKSPPKDGLAAFPNWERRSPLIARTGRGGAHLYFRHDDAVRNSADKVSYGVDVRGEGGYVIVPPSFGYKWQSKIELVTFDLEKLPLFPNDLRGTKRVARARHSPSDEAEVNYARIAAAMAAVPNNNLGWDDWNISGMAIWRATSGSEDGRKIFHAWSEKSEKYDADATDDRWDHYANSPPTEITAASIFYWAGSADPHWETKRGDNLFVRAPSEEQKPRPVILVQPGDIARVSDLVEKALVDAQRPVLFRSGKLFEPIFSEYPTSTEGAKTRVTVLRPITVAGLSYISNKHACAFEKYNHKTGKYAPCDPPSNVMRMILEKGHGPFPQVSGIISSPTMRPDGSILGGTARRLDAATGLWYDPDPKLRMPALSDSPTREDAATALALICDLLVEFPFVSPIDRAVALAAILTAVLRGAFTLTPMFLFLAHDAGTGKSFLVDLISTIVRGRPCPVVTVSREREEMEKRLGALLLEGIPLVSLDNCSVDLQGDLLCQMTERPTIKPRILGKSEVPECEWRGTLFATGNNIGFAGDMTRRGLTCNLDAKLARPELRRFKFNPVEQVHADRGKYIAAALTIARAYRFADVRVECDPIGSYEEWSRFVREPLLWAGQPDPVKSMDQARENDPGRRATRELIEQWEKHLGTERSYRTQEIIELASETRPSTVMKVGSTDFEYVRPELHDLLIAEVSTTGTQRGLNGRAFGKWLSRVRGQIYGQWKIEIARESESHGHRWKLMKV